MTRREEAAGWLRELQQSGMTMLQIEREAGIQYTTLATIMSGERKTIWGAKYNAIRDLYNRKILHQENEQARDLNKQKLLSIADVAMNNIGRYPKTIGEFFMQYGKEKYEDFPEEKRKELDKEWSNVQIRIRQIENEANFKIKNTLDEFDLFANKVEI